MCHTAAAVQQYSCGLCGVDGFSLSAALMIHKLLTHISEPNNDEPANTFAFIDELINEETLYATDQHFDYTILVTTSVTQTPKEYFVKEEPLLEIMPDDNVEHINVHATEPILPSVAVPPPSSIGEVDDPRRALCPVCGQVKSSNNMRRHLQVMHGTKIDPLFAACLRARIRESEQYERFVDVSPVTIVAAEKEQSDAEETDDVGRMSDDHQLDASDALQNDVMPPAVVTINQKRLVNPSNEQCPLCQKIGTIRNFKRHLRCVHKFSKSQLKDMNLQARSKCAICMQFLHKREIKKHFKRSHGITSTFALMRLRVAGLPPLSFLRKYMTPPDGCKQEESNATGDSQFGREMSERETIVIESPSDADYLFQVTQIESPPLPPECNVAASLCPLPTEPFASHPNPTKAKYPSLRLSPCRFCGKQMMAGNLKRHMSLVHDFRDEILPKKRKISTKPPQEKCPLCPKVGAIRNFENHLRSSHNFSKALTRKMKLREYFKCMVCMEFLPSRDITDHFEVCHGITDSLEVQRLRMTGLPPASFLHQYMSSEMGDAQQTTVTIKTEPESLTTDFSFIEPFQFTSKTDVPANNTTMHNEPDALLANDAAPLKQFYLRCSICQKASHQNNMRRHLRLVHKLDGSELVATMNVIAHQKSNVPHSQCSQCDYVGTAFGLRVHFRSKHLDHSISSERETFPFSRFSTCQFCGKKMMSGNLSRHMNSVHNFEAKNVPFVPLSDEKKLQTKIKTKLHKKSLKKSAPEITANDAVSLKQFYRRCSICKKAGHHNNMRRHLRQVHKLNGSELVAHMNLMVYQKPRVPHKYIGTARLRSASPENVRSATPSNIRSASPINTAEISVIQNEPMEFGTSPVTLVRRQENGAYACTMCVSVLSTRALTMEHLMGQHWDAIEALSDKRFNCDTCPIVLETLPLYKRHQTDHILKPDQELNLKRILDVRNFTCDICKNQFNLKSSLAIHMTKHSNTKSYKCPFDGCNATYVRRIALINHKKMRHTSTEERCHHCKICGKKFQLAKNLHLHIQTHKQSEKYQCDTCDMALSKKLHMKRHRASKVCWSEHGDDKHGIE